MKRGIGAVAALTVCGACASAPNYATGRPTLNTYSLSDEVALGTKLATVLIATAEANGRVLDPDDDLTRIVWRVAAGLLAVPENRARMPPLPWEVHSIGADIANAWCFPGGNLLVAAGLLRSGMARDEDELAALIGHELGHAAARHGTEKLTLQDLEAKLGPLGVFFGPRLIELAHPDTPLAAQEALASGLLTHDAVQEIEADIIGLELMARAGYDPAKAAAVWARRAAVAYEPVDRSHPASTARAQMLTDHVLTARYVASRRASPLPLRPPPWVWSDALPGTRSSTLTIPDVKPLADGPRARSPWLHAPRALLDVEVRVHAGPDGEGLRAAVNLLAGRDLREDRLPYTAELAILRVRDGDDALAARGAPIHTYALADRALLDAAVIRARVALQPLPPGRYVARVRVSVGATRTQSRLLFDVGTSRAAPLDATAAR